MQLNVVWHKPYWRAQQSPTGFAVLCCLGHPEFGGLSRQVEALSELFDAAPIVAPRSTSSGSTVDGRYSGPTFGGSSTTSRQAAGEEPCRAWGIRSAERRRNRHSRLISRLESSLMNYAIGGMARSHAREAPSHAAAGRMQ